MNSIPKITLLIFTLLISLSAVGQAPTAAQIKHYKDSITLVYMSKMALKNPSLRQAHFSTEAISSTDFNSKLDGSDIFDAKLMAMRYSGQFTASAFHIKKNKFSSNIGFKHQTFHLDKMKSYTPAFNEEKVDIDKTVINGSIIMTRMDTIGHLPIISNAIVSGIIDPESGQNKVIFTGLAMAPVKKNENTSLLLGFVLSLDPSAPFPIIPMISYQHRFNASMDIFIDPSRVTFRKQCNDKAAVMFSNNLTGNLALMQLESPLPYNSVFSTLELQSGLAYERLITNKMIFTLAAGANSVMSSKILEQNKSTDPFVKNEQKISPYIKFDVSFLPFWKGLDK